MNRLKKTQILEYKKKLVKAQGNKCAICEISFENIPTRDICLDHCHKTGVVRAALCRNCNGIEGKIFNLANRGKRQGTPRGFVLKLLNYWELYNVVTDNSVYHPDHKTEDEKREQRNKKARMARAKKRAMKNVKGH